MNRQARQQVSANPDLGISEQQLCTDVFTILRSGDSDEDIQISLVELLGYEAFDFIVELVSHRSTIVHNIIRMSDYDEQQQAKGARTAAQNEARRPVYGAQFIVQSEMEIREEKKLRKEQKKAMKANNNRAEGISKEKRGVIYPCINIVFSFAR